MENRAVKAKRKGFSLRYKITLYFSLILLIGLIGSDVIKLYGLPIIGLEGEVTKLRRETFNKLSLIADLKKEALTTNLEERRGDLKIFSEDETVVNNLPELYLSMGIPNTTGRTPEVSPEKVREAVTNTELLNHLKRILTAYSIYTKACIIDAATGRMLVSTNEDEIGTVMPTFPGSEKVPLINDVYFSILPDSAHAPTELTLSKPIEVIPGMRAIVILHLDYKKFFGPLLELGNILGNTGEVMLVDKHGKLLIPLKNPLPDGSNPEPLKFIVTAEPAKRALRGEEGIITAKDYRPKAVLAAYRYIKLGADTGWGMVVKQDEKEIFSFINEIIRSSVVVLLVFLLVLFAGTVVTANILTGRLNLLTMTVRDIGEGKTDVRVNLQSDDEIGELVYSFNTMLDTLNLREEALTAKIKEHIDTVTKLRESEARLAEAQRVAHLGSWEWDIVNNHLEWSREMYLLLGQDPDTFKGTYEAFLSAVSSEDRPLVVKAVNDALEMNIPYSVHFRVPGKDDADRIIHGQGSVKRDKDGKPLRMVGTLLDVTELKKAELEVKKLNEELEERVKLRTQELQAANTELESFAYSVSHDLRAPLRAIDGFSLALLEDYGNGFDEQATKYISRVRTATQHMSELIDDLLNLSRIMRGDIKKEWVDLSEQALNIVSHLREEEPNRKISVYIQQGMKAFGDRRLLAVALNNLIGNAFKFTSKTENAVVTFGMDIIKGKPEYFIKDNGAGFDQKYADQLFKPFQRLHTTKEYAGTGIGLATVFRILQRHGGKVHAEAEVGKGAAFYFTLES